MPEFPQLQLWFVVGSQDLYGDEALSVVQRHAEEIAQSLSRSPEIPMQVISKPVMTSTEAITRLCAEAKNDDRCVGVIAWMHTFSPGRMWIAGLNTLGKPLAHLHTQYNRDLPWSTIDMDFMNLNQSAHGDREFGFIGTRLRLKRKVISGFWRDNAVLEQLGVWARAAAGWHDAQHLKIARFGDNMRHVAVSEGDKVEAQVHLGFSVVGYGVGDLVDRIGQFSEQEVDRLVNEYDEAYEVAAPLRKGGEHRQAVREAARIELGLTAFLEEGGFRAFTDTFEDLHGLAQLPGVAVQRLMARGYGFGAEGDWKVAALVRIMKVMSTELRGGTSFMEEYTYHLGASPKVLGAHMLEVCPSLSQARPSLEAHRLPIGGKADPVRLVFCASSGPAVNACWVDLGNRFRMVANEVDVVSPDAPMLMLPVGKAVWIPKPDLRTAATAWIDAGGSHHTSFSQSLTVEHLKDLAEMAGIEFLRIDDRTHLDEFENRLRWNSAYYSQNTK